MLASGAHLGIQSTLASRRSDRRVGVMISLYTTGQSTALRDSMDFETIAELMTDGAAMTEEQAFEEASAV